MKLQDVWRFTEIASRPLGLSESLSFHLEKARDLPLTHCGAPKLDTYSTPDTFSESSPKHCDTSQGSLVAFVQSLSLYSRLIIASIEPLEPLVVLVQHLLELDSDNKASS